MNRKTRYDGVMPEVKEEDQSKSADVTETTVDS
jgi:hypothetical protein